MTTFTTGLLFVSILLILCVCTYKFLSRFGVPMLLVFIALGLLFGKNGLVKLEFSDFETALSICSFSLIFIIFFGGFGTKISAAKEVLVKALVLSSFGVLATALLFAFFLHFLFRLELFTSLILASVLSSTDAASVFSILRTHKLSLKDNTASLLEIESGSNDPVAYVLTLGFISLQLNAGVQGYGLKDALLFLLPLLAKQMILAVILALIFAYLFRYILSKLPNLESGFTMAFIMGTVLFCYSFVDFVGGNAYIAVYLFGIILGNSRFKNKVDCVHFFDGVTGIMQMIIFCLIGLLVDLKENLHYLLPAFLMMLILSLVVRPLVIHLSLAPYSPFKALRSKLKTRLLISWSGLRGAASVVFAMMAIVAGSREADLIFNITFLCVLFSIAVQGTFLPPVAKKLDMIDLDTDVLKTFNDYRDEEDIDFISSVIDDKHVWLGKKLKNVKLIPNVLLVLIIRGGKNIIPKGDTVLKEGDILVFCGSSFSERDLHLRMFENVIEQNSDYCNQYVKDIKQDALILMIKRQGESLIPNGETLIQKNDILVMIERS